MFNTTNPSTVASRTGNGDENILENGRHHTRSKRGRQPNNDDSVKLPATKKRRSALRRDTFEPLTASTLNEMAASKSDKDAKVNGDSHPAPSNPSRSTSQPKELTLRGGKKTEKRSERGQGLLTLSTNDFYTVSQLPALPDQIRSKPNVPYSCFISPENDYILALTHRDALVWSYNASSSNPSSRELLTFSLPFQPAPQDDPLPLGAFTPKSANGEPGIVIVSPTQGKVIHWDSLTAASTYGHSQSVEGTIPGMFYGELVKDLVPAEPVGFILTLASGRVAQLTTRDQLGRPAIGVQFMRKSNVGPTKSGFFGSIRNAFVGDRRKGLAIARPGRTARARRDIVVATEDGELELWTNNLLTGNQLTKTAEIKEQILSALETHVDNDLVDRPLQPKLIDFCINSDTPTRDLIKRDDSEAVQIVALIALSGHARSIYYLIELALVHDDVQVRVVHPIRCYSEDLVQEKTFSPRICIPSASRTAFVLFEKAVVVMSISKIEDTPSSQLLRDRGSLPQLFQDRILLKEDTTYRIINFAGENDSSPSCVLAIQGFGIARIASHLPNDDEIEIEDVTTQLSARARIEQAIFFGNKASNPLDLRRSQRDLYPLKDIREAVLLISRSIIMSSSNYIPKSASSGTSEQLQQRARALQDLVEYTLATYPTCLGREDRLAILRYAEKVAAAQALWKVQEAIQSTYPRTDDREKTYLAFVLHGLSEKSQKYPRPERGETDHVRHYLVYSVSALDRLLPELQDAMLELSDMNITDPRIVCDYFHEGLQLWTTAMETAFKFREDNAAIYGLGNETFKDGVLQSGYKTGPDALTIWTSTKEQLERGTVYLTMVCEFLRDWWNYSSAQQSSSKTKKIKEMPTNLDGEPYAAPSKSALRELTDLMPLQADILIRMLKEQSIQDQAVIMSTDLAPNEKARRVEQRAAEYRVAISEMLKKIAVFCRDGVIELAEAENDTDLLVHLQVEYVADLARQRQENPESRSIRQKIRQVQERIDSYYTRFGNKWAYSNFSSMIARRELGDLLSQGQSVQEHQPFLSWFFDAASQEGQHLGKIAWMNEVLGEDKFGEACKTLETVASTDESFIHNRKAEICLAKLSGLAALEEAASGISETKVSNFDHDLEYLHIVESLATHVDEVCALHIDDQAAVELAEERLIPETILRPKKMQSIRKQLSGTLYKLVRGQVVSLHELVDALTLLKLSPLAGDERGELDADVDDLAGSEFSAALQAITLANLRDVSQDQKNQLSKTVWRRLLVRDDWEALNATAGKSDAQVQESMERTVLFTTVLELLNRAERANIDVNFPSIQDILHTSKSKSDEPQEKLTEDAKVDLVLLKKYVDKARLTDRFKDLVEVAKKALRDYQNEQGEAQAANVLLNGSNGHVNGDHA